MNVTGEINYVISRNSDTVKLSATFSITLTNIGTRCVEVVGVCRDYLLAGETVEIFRTVRILKRSPTLWKNLFIGKIDVIWGTDRESPRP